VGKCGLADAVSTPTAQWDSRYRLGHWPVGFDGQPLGGGIESGSVYSQAYVSVDGVGDQSESILSVIERSEK